MIASLTFKVEENEANAEQELFDQIAQRCLHLIDQHTEAVLQVCFKSAPSQSSCKTQITDRATDGKRPHWQLSLSSSVATLSK